ncbi:BRAP2 RING ZnF UBP domain-containing protein 2 isoform X2 [Magnolia sinica]|uniref:BRAP2 RING ZnF UBP domain-containing protein 2 isoform X2 n=1 Tax=Magnolia sinica TaxID=86752 RepID=UPI00265B6E72|nr:BRAP2 RING ZnF UBP domain-containing protein 2 isoform X2 [Magnolia sinica]
MSATSTSSGAAAAAAEEDAFRPPLAMNSGSELTQASALTQAVHFSSGNPRIEETRGIMHLYSQDSPSASTSDLPVGRKPLVCVLAVPNHMTYADFCQFCGSFIQHSLEMRIVRNDGLEDRYSILIRFDSQNSADNFYRYFNGRHFSSLEVEVCCVLFTVDVQYTGSIEHAQTSLASSTEQPTCPVCLERLDQDISGILTTICNHSFHCSCISKWTDSSCPVCRYCQQQPEKSTCSICESSENLWICVICGFVGCGRYKEGHAIRHWKETQHCYSLELETQRVWDYVGDNYVHRLIQSKTDGKLVELNFHCIHANDGCGSCECSADSGISEALFNSKVEAYYESLLLEVKEETDTEISEAVEKAVGSKLLKIQCKLDKCAEEKKFLDEINENLMKNQEIWRAKILEIEERERMAVRLRDEKILDLEEQLRDLMVYIEGQKTLEQLPNSDEIKEGTILPIPVESSSSRNSSKRATRTNRRRG